MSTKDYAVSVLASLSEKKLKEFIMLFADENTIARMESDMLSGNPDTQHYSDFREFMQEMESEPDDE
ncbi:MAG: hypothetical protein NC548_60220 [Lachnospiraceae bacterium]|nr:hypothetical protein [Lachnospiraceae bacterium]MCM1233807.1 hypothetical protein [Ruminococcus flavefaciens]